MIKRPTIFILVLFLCLPIFAYASSIGGAQTQGKGKFAIGLDGDYVFERVTKAKSHVRNTRLQDGFGPGVTPVFFIQSNVDSPRINQMYRPMLKASYGIINDLDLYVKLGTTAGKMKESQSGSGILVIEGIGPFAPVNLLSDTIKYKINNAFTYGGGLKAAHNFDFLGGFILGCDLQYLRSENNYTASEVMGLNIVGFDTISIRARWSGKLTIQQWQAAPYIGKKFGNFTPYVGAKYSDIRITDKPKSTFKEFIADDPGGAEDFTNVASQSYKKEYKSRRNIGPFVGLDYKLSDNWKINLEGRFIDETAASLDLMYKF